KKGAAAGEIARSAFFFRCCRRGHAQESHAEPCRPAFHRARPLQPRWLEDRIILILAAQGVPGEACRIPSRCRPGDKVLVSRFELDWRVAPTFTIFVGSSVTRHSGLHCQTPADCATCVPFTNHVATLPLVSCLGQSCRKAPHAQTMF